MQPQQQQQKPQCAVALCDEDEQVFQVCRNGHVMHGSCIRQLVRNTSSEARLMCPLCRDDSLHELRRILLDVQMAEPGDDYDADEDEELLRAAISGVAADGGGDNGGDEGLGVFDTDSDDDGDMDDYEIMPETRLAVHLASQRLWRKSAAGDPLASYVVYVSPAVRSKREDDELR